jgi:hypothetical protein
MATCTVSSTGAFACTSPGDIFSTNSVFYLDDSANNIWGLKSPDFNPYGVPITLTAVVP